MIFQFEIGLDLARLRALSAEPKYSLVENSFQFQRKKEGGTHAVQSSNFSLCFWETSETSA